MRALTLAAAALCALPAAATASTWCYPAAACPSGVSGTATANVETAAQTNRADGTPDTIYLGAGSTYTDTDTLTPSGTDPLTIHGAGATSVLTTSSAAGGFVVDTQYAAGAVTFENLRIVVPPSLPDNAGSALQLTGDVIDGVDIDVQNVGSGGIGSAVDGNTIRNTHMYASGGGSLATGIDVNEVNGGGTVHVESTRIDRPVSGIYDDTATTALDLQRVTITDPSSQGITVGQGADGVVHNSVITDDGSAMALRAFTTTAGSSDLTADHVTVLRTSADAGPPLRATVGSANGTGSASITLTNSILRGYPVSWQRSAPASASIGDASITLAYSDFIQRGSDTGDGATTLGAGNIEINPLIVSDADLHLTPCSPAVDAGDPAGTSLPDRDGNPRVVDGNADGVARRDMGAYELQSGTCPPPAAPVAPPTTGTSDGGSSGGDLTLLGLSQKSFDTFAPVVLGLARRHGGLAFTLSEPATVSIRLAVRRAGRRWVAGKAIRTARGGGGSRVALPKLSPGVWRAVVIATDAAGNRSKSAKIVFRVRR